MDAVFVIDDIKEAVAVFQQDLKALKKDLKIGSDTLEVRVTSFLYSLESFENTLDQIKPVSYTHLHIRIVRDIAEPGLLPEGGPWL